MAKEKSLFFAYLLDREGCGKKLSLKEVEAYQPTDGLLWVHLNFTKVSNRRWLRQSSGIPKIYVQALTATETRPRTLINTKGLFSSLRGVNLNAGQDLDDMISIRVWIEQQMIVTTGRRTLRSILDIKESIKRDSGPKTAASFLMSLVSNLTNYLADSIADIQDAADELDEKIMGGESYLLRTQIAEMRRECVTLKRYLSPQRDALTRLYTDETDLLSQQDRYQLREITDRFIHLVEDLDAIRDRLSVTQEELSNRLAEQLNSRMYILSIVAVIFLPLSFLTGLLGINVGGIPLANSQSGFLVISGVLIAVAVSMAIAFKVKKWM